MGDDKHNNRQNLFDKLIAFLLRQSWLDVLGDVGKIVRKIVQGRSYRGLYEVLEYEATLELEDQGGKRATFKKREKVRYKGLRMVVSEMKGMKIEKVVVVKEQQAAAAKKRPRKRKAAKAVEGN